MSDFTILQIQKFTRGGKVVSYKLIMELKVSDDRVKKPSAPVQFEINLPHSMLPAVRAQTFYGTCRKVLADYIEANAEEKNESCTLDEIFDKSTLDLDSGIAESAVEEAS